MRELSLNILDICENSFRANATLVEVSVVAKDNLLTITIKDNGCGMDSDFLSKVTDPFTTSRNSRKVGLGIPLLKMEAEMSGGEFFIDSKPREGTIVKSSFLIDSIDRPPLGNISEAITSMISYLDNCDLVFNFKAFDCDFTLDTREVKKELGDIPINDAKIIVFLKGMIEENIKTKSEGVSL